MSDSCPFEQLLGIVNSALSSPLSIAIFSTFIAAFAGTWGAQILAERTARRKELLHEIRGVNAALSFAFNIANSYISTKKQHIREIVTNYKQQRVDREAHLLKINALILLCHKILARFGVDLSNLRFSHVEAGFGSQGCIT